MKVVKTFLVWAVFCMAGAYSTHALAEVRDLRDASFAEASRTVETTLNWFHVLSGNERFELEFFTVSDGSQDSCSAAYSDTRSVTAMEQIIPILNDLPIAELRLEVAAMANGAVAGEWVFLLNKPLDFDNAESVLFRAFGNLNYDDASTRIVDGIFGADQSSRDDVQMYRISYTDNSDGSEVVRRFDSATALSGILDELGAGDHRVEITITYTSGEQSLRQISFSKSESDIAEPSVDMRLAWVAPSRREDGTSLASEDISGYEIYVTRIEDDNTMTDQVITVDDPTQTEITLGDMTRGEYHLAMSTVGSDGQKSAMSNIVTYNVQ